MAGRDSWELSAQAFEHLLDLLGGADDRDGAGRRYQEIRERLVRLFEWRGARFPEDLADETVFRVARRLDQGVEVRAEDPYNYFCGVAFMVFKEVLRERQREQTLADPHNWPAAESAEPPAEDERMTALLACLDELPTDQRALLLDYQRDEGGRRIANRKRLAERLDIPLNALRIRVHRLRVKIERCLERQISRDHART